MTERSLKRDKVHYFSAGPSLLCTDVAKTSVYDFFNYKNLNIGIGEISHRSEDSQEIINQTKSYLVELLDIPDNYEIFFLQGGGTLAFASIPYNLMSNYVKKNNCVGRVAYSVTGLWSKKAAEEAKRLNFEVDIVCDTSEIGHLDIPSFDRWSPLKKNTAYLYLCDNETANGVEYNLMPEESYLPQNVELVCDMSSSILSKKIDVSKYGLIFAACQKNIGIAGLTVFIVKKLLLEMCPEDYLHSLGVPVSPMACNYEAAVKYNSVYNTICMFPCYVCNLVLKKCLESGGVKCMNENLKKKADLIYSVLKKYPDFYIMYVKNPAVYSSKNITFTLSNNNLVNKFLKNVEEKKIFGIKGHHSVGGIRISIYNLIPYDSVVYLSNFLIEFRKLNL